MLLYKPGTDEQGPSDPEIGARIGALIERSKRFLTLTGRSGEIRQMPDEPGYYASHKPC